MNDDERQKTIDQIAKTLPIPKEIEAEFAAFTADTVLILQPVHELFQFIRQPHMYFRTATMLPLYIIWNKADTSTVEYPTQQLQYWRNV